MAEPTPTETAQQLADDLHWLEEHCCRLGDAHGRGIDLRMAGALVRNAIAPALKYGAAEPLHIAVVGGAGTGKSTIVNFLCGSVVAEANPQAGFTRHPVAYVDSNAASWNANGVMSKLTLAPVGPSSRDEDVYQVRPVTNSAGRPSLLGDFVVWDCPDMTTYAASGYAVRLLEAAALADVIAFVASDERYNDAVPTQFLQLILSTGKPVVVVLTKMKADQIEPMLEHFRKSVLENLPKGRVNCLAIPWLSAQELADPGQAASAHGIALVNQAMVLGDPPAAARRRTVDSAIHYLKMELPTLLAPAQRDLAVLDEWRVLVRRGKEEFDERYRREFLAGEKFPRFDQALVRLLELLELPGAFGKVVSNTLWVARAPYRGLKWLMGRVLAPAEATPMPEKSVLDSSLTAWLDSLRAEALRKSADHPLWRQVAEGFTGSLGQIARERYQESLQNFHRGLNEDVEKTARAIYEDLEKSPTQLNALRGGKFALDIASITSVVIAGGIGYSDLVLVPLAASASHLLVEWFGSSYVETQKEQARQRQFELETKNLSTPLVELLSAWPASGGTEFEKLQAVVNRIPSAVDTLVAAIRNPPGATA